MSEVFPATAAYGALIDTGKSRSNRPAVHLLSRILTRPNSPPAECTVIETDGSLGLFS
jgi:hypothetical protein